MAVSTPPIESFAVLCSPPTLPPPWSHHPRPAPTVALNLTMALSPSRFQGPTIPPPFCYTAWVVAQVICKWPADEAEGLGNIGTTSTNIRNRNSTTHSHRTTVHHHPCNNHTVGHSDTRTLHVPAHTTPHKTVGHRYEDCTIKSY